ncbi:MULTISPECIES: DUF2235 domain-containing protein [Pseudomonas]|uniref:DUF2235 domain-containing protein n=1 Tax=Pseudomonas TaxID=286 RepID=UPI001E49B4A6|nr:MULTISPECIES: DUF2235 domain-containing protein [Pseudomonas]MCE1117066.1 DUF2235 domain-containing protein [Pseudomonas sp. NMI795_08]
MPKKIIISFDGTWNTPDTKSEIKGSKSTNVWKLHAALLARDKDGTTQNKWYDAGVGTDWYDRLSGGAFGVGLSEKILDGYRHLASTYEPGDLVHIFGFSRGAYTARSLVGLIRNAGLLKPEHLDLAREAYGLYRTRDEGADSDSAQLFRSNFSRTITIHMLGIWDTVGALGVPLESFDWFNKSYYEFHDTELSSIVHNAFHAVAIDEWRKNYQCTLWDPKSKPNQRVEQVWFSGAHANIGGGYPDSSLSDIALTWMINKAVECGLAVDTSKIPSLPTTTLPITNSYKQFLGGAYSKFNPPYYRDIGQTQFGREAIDSSVEDRLKHEADYKPKNAVGPNLVGSFTPVGKVR